jgi:LemA protein
MKGILGVVGVLVGIVVVVGLWFASANNRFVKLNEQVRTSWSQVENAYQRRSDLIPNLVETVKGAANFEKSTLQEVTEARSQATRIEVSADVLNDPQKFQQFQEAQRSLSGALSRLLATVEAYPDLKATQAYRDLMSQLEGTENRISVERKRFNDSVNEYNVGIQQFPGRIAAGFLGYQPKPYFQADPGANVAPKVKF